MLQLASIRYGSLFRYFLVTVGTAIAGLNYLHVKHQYHLTGLRKVVLERELNVLLARSRDLDWQVSALASHAAVQARINVVALKLKDIPEAAVINLRLFPTSTAQNAVANSSRTDSPSDELQTISHERGSFRATP